MAGIEDDLADFLSTGGISTTMFKDFLPERPDEALQILRTGGYPPVHRMSATAGNPVEERPTVQILRRSQSVQRALAEMNVIWRMLDGAGDVTINGTRYFWVEAMQSPFPFPRDETNRARIVCNFMACKAVTTATST